ncbi:MAG: hypothetical protein WAV20_14785 [Blastocatellia bacterium]
MACLIPSGGPPFSPVGSSSEESHGLLGCREPTPLRVVSNWLAELIAWHGAHLVCFSSPLPVENYVHQALGITDEKLEQIRENLLRG